MIVAPSKLFSTSVLLAAHLMLILSAASDFTLLDWLWRPGASRFTFSWLSIAYRNGWGHDYVSAYSFAQVWTYLVGYAVGLPAFLFLRRNGLTIIGSLGAATCLAGLASFGLEATHWAVGHHFSMIVSFPLGDCVLTVLAGIAMAREWKRQRGSSASASAGSTSV